MLAEVAMAPLLPLGIALVNGVTWRRLQPSMSRCGVSVLIPARNEERNIARCISAALASVHLDGSAAVREVIVYDDDSTDETRAIVKNFCDQDARVRLLLGGPLPPSWTGKAHACQRLGNAAKGAVLLFVDADVQLKPHGVSGVLGCLDGPTPIDVLTAVPEQRTETLAERCVVSFMLVTYLSWLPLLLIETSADERVLAANGQMMAMHRETWAKLGGFESARNALVEDMALTRYAKKLGLRVAMADATDSAVCRMYQSTREVWRGFSKNIAPGLGGSAAAVALATSLYGLCFVAPYYALFWGILTQDPRAQVFGLVGVLANLALRTLTTFRYRQPLDQIALHPFAALAVIAIAWNSWFWTFRRKIHWAGRTYSGAES